jgi:hypothetical protein
MKTLIYQVYTGKRSKLYDACTASVKDYAKRIGAEYICQRQPILMIKPDPFQTNRSKESYEKYGGFLPIYEKENAFSYLKSNDQIAIIDADVYIRPECSESIFDAAGTDVDFAGVLERDMPTTPAYTAKIANYSRMQYGMNTLNGLFDWKHPGGANFYNMGIMVLNKSISKYLNGETPQQFLRRSRFKPFIDGIGAWKWSTDQTLLNVWVKEEKMKVKNLSFHWNGLFTGIEMDKIKECHFVHFFLKDKLPNRGENVDELLKVINNV